MIVAAISLATSLRERVLNIRDHLGSSYVLRRGYNESGVATTGEKMAAV